MARANTSLATFGVGSVWFDAVETGARAWVSALTGLTQVVASAVEAQAEIAGEMVSFWMRGFPRGALPVPSLLREELLFTGIQAERVADAARKTLQDLDRPGGKDVPIPLPE